MLVDARTLDDGAELQADICIVGSGPAGLAIAREFAGRDVRVCILESGGRAFEGDTQELAAGELTGEPTNPPVTSRRRQLGGSVHLWDSQLGDRVIGMRCAPLDDIDFESRPSLPRTGWPFGSDELTPFYARAQTYCGLGPLSYHGDHWETRETPAFRLGSDVETKVWQFGPRSRHLEMHLPAVEQASNITTLLHANVLEVETTETAGSVTRLRAAALGGPRFTVAARLFILAAGGFENARLLLLSDRVQRGGLGNAHDQVGRCYMDHPLVCGGALRPPSRDVFDRAGLYDVRTARGTVIMGRLCITEEAQRREELLNSCLLLLPRHSHFLPESFDSVWHVLDAVRARRTPARLRLHLGRIRRGLPYIGAVVARKLARRPDLFPHLAGPPSMTQGAGWSLLPGAARLYDEFDAWIFSEQLPDPENRVMLGEERDALGSRTLRLQWRWDAESRRQAQRAQAFYTRAVRTAGWRLVHDPETQPPHLRYPSQHHHLGTTRMAENAKRGVVDADGRVHGTENLYIAGGSVFPTGGYINPTLTIVALALRLADHVRTALGSTGEPAITAASTDSRHVSS